MVMLEILMAIKILTLAGGHRVAWIVQCSATQWATLYHGPPLLFPQTQLYCFSVHAFMSFMNYNTPTDIFFRFPAYNIYFAIFGRGASPRGNTMHKLTENIINTL